VTGVPTRLAVDSASQQKKSNYFFITKNPQIKYLIKSKIKMYGVLVHVLSLRRELGNYNKSDGEVCVDEFNS